LSACSEDDDEIQEIVSYQTTLNQLDELDKGGRWLANGIKETNELGSLEEEQEAVITNYLNDLALNPATRCDDVANESFVNDLTAESYPQQAIEIVENAIIRVCSPLNYHEAYWVTEINDQSVPFPIQIINDMHIDAATKRITVYAQMLINGQISIPAQVGPGECTTAMTGETACYHPNAVYLNGSGEEFLQADGTGSWWVKHSWILDGEGYQNWEMILEEDYGEGLWVEGILLEDGITMKVGDIDGSDGGFYNHRKPLLENTPITYSVERFLPPSTTPDFILEWQCTTETSAFDGLARSCPQQ
jgi:hypothetical protein